MALGMVLIVATRTTHRSSSKQAFRSGLESTLAKQLASKGIPYAYEEYKLDFLIPESSHKYMPDFVLPNGIIIESKGIFDADDRKKHLLIKEQYPTLDIRFVFSRSKSPLYRGAKSTYADWCHQHSFLYADKLIPERWLGEPIRSVPPTTILYKWRKK